MKTVMFILMFIPFPAEERLNIRITKPPKMPLNLDYMSLKLFQQN